MRHAFMATEGVYNFVTTILMGVGEVDLIGENRYDPKVVEFARDLLARAMDKLPHEERAAMCAEWKRAVETAMPSDYVRDVYYQVMVQVVVPIHDAEEQAKIAAEVAGKRDDFEQRKAAFKNLTGRR